MEMQNHGSVSGKPMDESGFGGLNGERYLSDCIVPSVKFDRRGLWFGVVFPGVGLSPLVAVKGTLKPSVYQDI